VGGGFHSVADCVRLIFVSSFGGCHLCDVVVVSLVVHWFGSGLLFKLGPSCLWMVTGGCPLLMVGPLASRFSSVVPMGGLLWVRFRGNWFGRRCGDGAVCLVCGGGLAMEMETEEGEVWTELS
jgi:hypothetical protein